MAPTYDPTVFNVASRRQAQEIILTPEAGMTTEERWRVETPDIIERIAAKLPLPQDNVTTILDWGCGIGRLAKPLCEWGLFVTGVDLSADMRRLAVRYVDQPNFSVLAPSVYEEHGSIIAPCSYDAAIAAWALQHIPKIERACAAIRRVLVPGAPLFVLNRVERVIPVVGGWMPDGKDVPAALRDAGFQLESEEALGPPIYADGSVWSVWRAGPSTDLVVPK